MASAEEQRDLQDALEEILKVKSHSLPRSSSETESLESSTKAEGDNLFAVGW